MVNNKKNKRNKDKTNTNTNEKDKKPSVYRTLEQRKEEIRKIINKLEELQLASADYEPIKKFYDIMFNYIRTGQRTILNIPFPEINKRIEGILAININEECAIRLKYEKY